MADGKTAIIAGASGLVGRHCLRRLLTSNEYGRVIAVGRRTLDVTHDKLTQVEVDFDALNDFGDRMQADDVFCCLGSTMRKAGSRDAFRLVDYEYPLRLARVARRRGATQFAVISSLGANPRALAFYSRVKGEVEAALAEVEFETLLIFRPSILLGARQDSRPFETTGKFFFSVFAPLFLGPLRRLRPIYARSVAEAMVRAANSGLRGVHVLELDDIEKESQHARAKAGAGAGFKR